MKEHGGKKDQTETAMEASCTVAQNKKRLQNKQTTMSRCATISSKMFYGQFSILERR